MAIFVEDLSKSDLFVSMRQLGVTRAIGISTRFRGPRREEGFDRGGFNQLVHPAANKLKQLEGLPIGKTRGSSNAPGRAVLA